MQDELQSHVSKKISPSNAFRHRLASTRSRNFNWARRGHQKRASRPRTSVGVVGAGGDEDFDLSRKSRHRRQGPDQRAAFAADEKDIFTEKNRDFVAERLACGGAKWVQGWSQIDDGRGRVALHDIYTCIERALVENDA